MEGNSFLVFFFSPKIFLVFFFCVMNWDEDFFGT